MQLKGLLICMPAYGQMNYMQTTQSLYQLGVWLTANKIPSAMTASACSDIEEGRNLFATLWYDGWPEQFSHMLMVDSDMEFPWEMVRDMLAFDRDLIGTIYSRRQYPAVAIGRGLEDADDQHRPSTDALRDALKKGFVPMAGVGGGVLLFSREVIRQIVAKFPEVVDTKIDNHPVHGALEAQGCKRILRVFGKLDLEDGTRLSEDLAFCERWRQCGGTVWANGNYHIGHVGAHTFTVRYADFLEKKAAEAKLGANEQANRKDRRPSDVAEAHAAAAA